MRTTVIPAQITTLEDKIVGNLSFLQICFLMFPVMWSMLVYMLFPPGMKFALYKLPVILLVSVISLVMAIRIKDKIVFDWLAIVLRYTSRPMYYVFSKNDTYLRTLDLPTLEPSTVPVVEEVVIHHQLPQASETELVKLDKVMRKRKYAVTFAPDKKGGLHVAVH